MTTIDAHPPAGEHETPTQLDREQALTVWRALLPTWTYPGARFRDPAALASALSNPTACQLVAERLTARASTAQRAGVSR